eukprot:scpid59496/ scgid27823/ Protein preY, mitochondrial
MCSRLAFTAARYLVSNSSRVRNRLPTTRCCSSQSTSTDASSGQFDVRMLEFVACPLSKKPLRYDAEAEELVCDDIGVAYPIRSGIPCLVPDDGRVFKKDNATIAGSTESKS